MSPTTAQRPTMPQQVAAIASLAALATAAIYVLTLVVSQLPALLLGIAGFVLTLAGLWWIVTEHLPRRAVGIAMAIVGVLAMAFSITWANGAPQHFVLHALLVVLCLGGAGVLARIALVHDLHAGEEGDVQVFTPRHPVLLYNVKSGGGKVASFGLLGLAAEHGVETVELTPGSDLAELARDAVARGADCLAMAGGDGSQALVASIAVECGVPFVCIPAGTRNHFALDLGLDREDPRLAMAAFTEGALRNIDYATVNGRLFVNNVSLGVYATIVQSDDYRDAKVATSTALLPELVGGTAEPFDLQFTAPDGTEVDDVFVILVSNNPYVIGPSLGTSQRPSLVSGRLGVVAAHARTGADAVAVLAEATLHLNRTGGLMQFQREEFEVRSRGGSAYVGIDGEALDMATPLEFDIHPGGLRMLVPIDRVDGPPQGGRRKLNVRALARVASGQSAS